MMALQEGLHPQEVVLLRRAVSDVVGLPTDGASILSVMAHAHGVKRVHMRPSDIADIDFGRRDVTTAQYRQDAEHFAGVEEARDEGDVTLAVDAAGTQGQRP